MFLLLGVVGIILVELPRKMENTRMWTRRQTALQEVEVETRSWDGHWAGAVQDPAGDLRKQATVLEGLPSLAQTPRKASGAGCDPLGIPPASYYSPQNAI